MKERRPRGRPKGEPKSCSNIQLPDRYWEFLRKQGGIRQTLIRLIEEEYYESVIKIENPR
jgi:hypothetical protein